MVLDEDQVNLTPDQPLYQHLAELSGFAPPGDWDVGSKPGPSGLQLDTPQPSDFMHRPTLVASGQATPAETGQPIPPTTGGPITSGTGEPDSIRAEQSTVGDLEIASAAHYSPATHSTPPAMMKFLQNLCVDEPYQHFVAKLKPVRYGSLFF